MLVGVAAALVGQFEPAAKRCIGGLVEGWLRAGGELLPPPAPNLKNYSVVKERNHGRNAGRWKRRIYTAAQL
jgi:hypothetical protein